MWGILGQALDHQTLTELFEVNTDNESLNFNLDGGTSVSSGSPRGSRAFATRSTDESGFVRDEWAARIGYGNFIE